MKSETLDTLIGAFCPESSKVIIADDNLRIIYTSRPELFTDLSKIMFSRSGIIDFTDSIFPIKSKCTLTFCYNGIKYIAIVRPFDADGEHIYIIEVLDSFDFSEIEQHSQSYISELISISQLRTAVSESYAAQAFMSDSTFMNYPKATNILNALDRSQYLVLSAIAGKEELRYYTEKSIKKDLVNLSKITSEVCDLCALHLKAKNISLNTKIDNYIIRSCDAERYTAVLMNLIVNAALYNISEDKKIDVSLKEADDEIRLTVKDNGVGMTLDQIEKAFIPYALCRLDETGCGLGLPITNMFAKTFGGSVSIISEVDVGTTVTVRLPSHNEISYEMRSPEQRYTRSKFSLINVYLSKILYK